MILRYFALSIVALCLPGSLLGQEFDYDTDLGLAAVDATGRICVTIGARNLAQGTRLTLVWVPAGGTAWEPQVTEAEVLGRRDDPCDIPGADPDDSAYEAVAIDTLDYATEPYFSGLFGSNKLVIEGRRVRGDVDGDGIAEEFRACTSREGLHMSVWTGEPLKGQRRWRRYYYLGYDVEPSCEDRDFGIIGERLQPPDNALASEAGAVRCAALNPFHEGRAAGPRPQSGSLLAAG